ncbi:type VI secretion system baseplate subunit TssF/IglH [Facilibium subflavum]|uniref:type VI secretion system baseplate subunit TssF/IglH n=1 Tax=Facilibium subflavum TaxID=2219058 RepID=UPI000E64889F|nr:type VI secretion system baseplate subunit TssF/IglH [Facilibium subflavum]
MHDFLTESMDQEKSDDDLSDGHYQLLTNTFMQLSKNIQEDIRHYLREEQDYRLSRYNQNLLMPLPKHMLVNTFLSMKNMSLDLEAQQSFDVYDISAKRHFIYTTQSQVIINNFKVTTDDTAQSEIFYVTLQPKTPAKLDRCAFELWINPALWSKLEYRLAQLKSALFHNEKIWVELYYDDGSTHHCQAHLEDIRYTLPMNDVVRLMLTSPEFFLGFKVVLDQMPIFSDAKLIKAVCLFDVSALKRGEIREFSAFKDNLFKNNIIPLFNLYEGYSSAQKLDDTYDKIPLIHAEDPSARAFYVHQVWENNQLYKEYYHHIFSEYVFHKHVGKLGFYPKNIKESVTQSKKVFVKAMWSQNVTHGHLLKLSSNAINAAQTRYELVCLKPGVSINNFRYVDRVVQVFRAFSDLDMRNKDAFLIALKFLCGAEYIDIYQKFKSAVRSIEYNAVSNGIIIEVQQASDFAFVEHIANVISTFFYVNSPQAIQVNTQVANIYK